MKHTFFLIFVLITSLAFGQDVDQLSKEIMNEGIELYRNERASWISTDSLTELDKQLISNYFTYSDEGKFISVYIDKSDKIADYKFTFQPLGNLEIELIKKEKNVPLSEKELEILKVRKTAIALSAWHYGQLGYTQIVNPNVIIFRTSPEYIVYVVPGAKQSGLLPIGGDLKMTFRADGELDKIVAIHNNLIPFETEASEEGAHFGHEHKGKRLAKEYMTATDVCTILLYRQYLKGEKHLSVHKKFISEFYFNEPRLVIRPNTEKMKIR